MKAVLKQGYKQTEVGVIPEDWEVKTVGEIAEVKTGPFGSALHEKDYVANGTPIITVEHLGERGVYHSNLPMVSDADRVRLKAYSIRSGDLVFSRVGSVDRNALVRANEDGWLFSGRLLRVRLKNKAIDPHYLSFHFHSERFKQRVRRVRDVAVGQTMASINTKILMGVSAIIPPTKAEQEAIAEALSDTDALIESLEQLVAKKRHIKQGAMQELLTGKKRLPGFSEEWQETSLLELAGGKKELFDDGDWIESEHITNDGVRLIQTGNIGVGQFVDKEIKKYIFESSFVSLRCKELREGDLLICRLAEPAGRACVLSNIGEPKIVTSVDVTIFRPPSTVANRIFLANLFSTNQWFRDVSDRSGGTTHKRISRGALGRLKITIPTLPEQTAIATILSDMDAEIAALETKLTKTRSIKQGMMHELLTGKTRLI